MDTAVDRNGNDAEQQQERTMKGRRVLLPALAVTCFAAAATPSASLAQLTSNTGTGAPQAHLGLRAASAGTDPARHLGVSQLQGAVVTVLTPGAPAAQAGLRIGDLIVQFGDREINLIEDLVAVVEKAPIGSQHRVVFVRGLSRHQVHVTFGSRSRKTPAKIYTHRQGAYRFRIPDSWQILPHDQPDKSPDARYDIIRSTDANYEFLCFHGSWPVHDPARPLDGWISRRLAENPGSVSARFTINGHPAGFVGYEFDQNELRRVAYRLAVARAGRRYVINIAAPVFSDPNRLPHPAADVLSTLQCEPAPAIATPVPPPAPTPATTEAPAPMTPTPAVPAAVPPVEPTETRSTFDDLPDPEASLALVRGVDEEALTQRLEDVEQGEFRLGDWTATTYTGRVTGARQPARAWIVIPLEGPWADSQTAWVGFGRLNQFARYRAMFENALRTVRPLEPKIPEGD
jgi:hypothetical protein